MKVNLQMKLKNLKAAKCKSFTLQLEIQ